MHQRPKILVINYSAVSTVVTVLVVANFLASCGGSSMKSSNTVTPLVTTTSITNSLSTATVTGQSYTVNVSVAGNGTGMPTGTATVSDGTGATCTATLTAGSPSTGNCALSSTAAGNKTVAATYSGDASFAGSASAGVAHTVNPDATTATITNSLSTATPPGQGYAVNISVAANAPGAGSPTGTATVSDGSGGSCTATLTAGTPSTGSCTLTSNTAGNLTVSVAYNSDGNFAASTSAGVAHAVGQAPAIISPSSEAFTIGNAGTFTVAASGAPAPALSETGTLPSGLTFTDNGNGTATLTGTPAAGTSGTYSIKFTASNGFGSQATQTFSLGVNGNFGFVTNNTGGNVTVIDLSANAATGQSVSLSAGATPQGIAINPVDTLFAYVANGASKDVQVFCTRVEGAICPTEFAAPTIGGAIKAASADHAHVADSSGVNPAPFTNTTDVIIASTGLFGFVVDNGAGMVFKIDTNRTSPTFNQILGSGIPIPGAARADIRLAADFAYVADGKAEVVAINTGTGVATNIPISVTGTTSYAVAASPDGNSVYVTDPSNGQVHVISSSALPGSYVASTDPAGLGGLLAGATPHGIRFSPDGRFVYVADKANNVVATIDPATLNTSSSPGVVSVVNNSIALVATLAGTGPEEVSPTANSDQVFVTDTSSNTATAIDGAVSSGTFRTALVTFGGPGTFNGAFAIATAPNQLLHIADPVPDTAVGAAYDWQVVALGGAPPYAFSITNGSLPPGLTMDTSGHITGTAETSGSFTFTVTVVDGPNNQTQSASNVMAIFVAEDKTIALIRNLPNATVNVPYNASINGNTDPNLPLSYDNTLGPCGLELGLGLASDGVFGGTPEHAGTCPFQVIFLLNGSVIPKSAAPGGTLIVDPDFSTALLSAAPSVASSCNQQVVFTGEIKPGHEGPTHLAGGVTFTLDGSLFNGVVTTLQNSFGGSFQVTLGAGTHNVRVNFDPTTNDFTPSGATLDYTVPPCQTQTPTTTTITGTTPIAYGKPNSKTVIVIPIPGASGTPTGTVNVAFVVTQGGIPIGTVVLTNGSGSVMDPLPVGNDTVQACYSGDANFAASCGTFVQTVVQASSTTTGSASLNPVVVGQSIMLNAAIAPQFTGSPTGNVNFYDASAGATCSSPGTSTLLASNGVANGTTSVGPFGLNSAGTHTILVCYSGDSNFTGSSTTFTETVNKANTVTTVSSSTNPAEVGQSVMFFTNVHAAPPSAGAPLSGTVTFTVDGVAGSPISVSSASFSTSSLTAGTHTVTAAYSGDSNTNPSDSTGAPFSETVNPALAIIARTPFGQLPDALLGFPYVQTLDVIGGTPPLTFSVSSSDFTGNVGNTGTACQGLSVDSSTGAITGTPTMLGTCGSSGFITVNDAVHGPPLLAGLNIPVRKRQAYIAGPAGGGINHDTVEVIDTGGKSFLTSIDATAGEIPSGIAVTRNGRFALVNFNQINQPFVNSRMLVIDTTTNTTLTVGNGFFLFNSCLGPGGVAIGTVPVATIAGISRVGDTVTVTTTAAHSLAIQELVAVSGVGDNSFDGAFLITNVTATTFTYSQTAPDATSSGGSVLAERAYVGCSNSEIGLIDMSANSGNPNDITPAGLTNLGNGNSTFDGITITPDASKLFAVDSTNAQFFVVTTATNAVTGPFSLCTNPKGIAITPAGDRAYVACDSNTIAVINTATNAVTTITTVNMTATDNWNDVAVTPDGTRVYVTAATTGDFTVIDNTAAIPAPIPASPINVTGSALQGLIIPPLIPVPASGLPVFIADSTTSPTTTSSVDIRDDSPIIFPADATPLISLTPGALDPAGTGSPIGIASTPVPYLFIATTTLSPSPSASTAYASAPLAARGGVGALSWSATFTGAACGSGGTALTINPATGIISGTPGASGTGACTINLTVTDSTAQAANATIAFTL